MNLEILKRNQILEGKSVNISNDKIKQCVCTSSKQHF